MKKILFFLFLISIFIHLHSQVGVRYDPAPEQGKSVQYFKPSGERFVGDCIPFYHEGTYYLYWLLDSGHHHALNGLGGHQWTLSTSNDLINWKYYPIVIGTDEEWEKSICTGSVVYYKSKFYAFYATRLIDNNGKVNEQLSYAVSNDGIHFDKQKPNPFYKSAPGYNQRNFRDPKVFVDSSGNFHLFVSSATENDSMNLGETGALVHLVSKDLKQWEILKPIITNQTDVPECPDYFKWNDWYYIVYGQGGDTYYLKSKKQYGPWQYPKSQVLKEEWSNVVKIAAFKNNRRISAGWIPSRHDNKDDGGEIFGGNALLRELTQENDGTLDSKFVPELIPATGNEVPLNPVMDDKTKIIGHNSYEINSPNGLAAIQVKDMPADCRITMTIEPEGILRDYGVTVRSTKTEDDGYSLNLSPNNKDVSLFNTKIQGLDFLDKAVTLDIILKGDIVDVCIGNKRCIVNRLIERKGNSVWLFVRHGKVRFKNVTIRPLILSAN
ncbi:MAG: family 43 glycosylhydrolase [Chitinophagaceae bacterium]